MQQNYNITGRIFNKSQSNPIVVIKSLKASIHSRINMTQFIRGAQLGGWRGGGIGAATSGGRFQGDGKINILNVTSIYCSQHIASYSAK